MIGGLIEQQNIIVLQENFGQFNPHTPATRKALDRFVKISISKAQTFQNFFGFTFILVAAK